MDMLKGKVAVVTGGTRGIGYSIVETFLRNGATVVLLGSRQETVDKALASLKEADPAWPVEGFAPKLDDYNAMRELFAQLHESMADRYPGEQRQVSLPGRACTPTTPPTLTGSWT